MGALLLKSRTLWQQTHTHTHMDAHSQAHSWAHVCIRVESSFIYQNAFQLENYLRPHTQWKVTEKEKELKKEEWIYIFGESIFKYSS